MIRSLTLVVLFSGAPALSESPALSIPVDSPRWDLRTQNGDPQDHARLADFQGRSCLMLDGAVATLKDFEVSSAFSFVSHMTEPITRRSTCASISPVFPTPCNTRPC